MNNHGCFFEIILHSVICVWVCVCVLWWVCVCVCMCMLPTDMSLKKDNPAEVRVFSSYHVGLGDPTQVLRLCKKCLCLLNLRADHMDISYSLKYSHLKSVSCNGAIWIMYTKGCCRGVGFKLPSQVCLNSELIRTRNTEFNQKVFVNFTLLVSQMMGFFKICFYAMQDNCVFDSLIVVVLLLPENKENHILCSISQCNSIKEFVYFWVHLENTGYFRTDSANYVAKVSGVLSSVASEEVGEDLSCWLYLIFTHLWNSFLFPMIMDKAYIVQVYSALVEIHSKRSPDYNNSHSDRLRSILSTPSH